jgi:hypothetical protein
MADISTVRLSDDYSIFICKKNSANGVNKKTNVMMVYVVDNSGSMGYMTQACATAFGQIYDLTKNNNINMLPGALILFSESAQVLSTNIKSVKDIQDIRFPGQGQTNITAGIEAAVNVILNHKKSNGDDVHYIINFLSDGGHNCGQVLDKYLLNTWKWKLDTANVRLSVIVVGVINPDTTLGMLIKTNLETVEMAHLDSVYFAREQYSVQSVLEKVQTGFVKSLDDCTIVKLKIDNAVFISDNMSDVTTCFLSNGAKQSYFVVKHTDKNKDYTFYANDIKINNSITIKQLCKEDITEVIDAISPKLSQKNIANGVNSIREQVKLLEGLIDCAENFFKALLDKENKEGNAELTVEDIGKKHMKPFDRLQMIKKLKTVKNDFATEKNKLKLLLVTVENSSAKQADYLNGVNKKYAAKAINKSDMTDVSLDQIYNDTCKVAQEISNAKNNNDYVESDPSILSFNTPKEQYIEWLSVKDRTVNDFDNIYAFLSFCGFTGYPIKFEHNNAVQMDPFQTNCLDIEPYVIDSPSIMLANQMNYKQLKSPLADKPITDILVLVNPSCPNASLSAMNSMLYKYLCSVTLCRDLYMFNPKMSFSLHAHSLLKSIDLFCETNSEAYLKLALNIVYSAYKLKINYPTLFKHWIQECNGLTQGERDNCSHPVQLLLLLGLNSIETDDVFIPLTNMLNETMSRIMKIKLASIPNITANSFAQELFGINADNSPKPNMVDVLSQEPSNEDVRNSCTNVDHEKYNSDVLNKLYIKQHSVSEFVDTMLKPYVRTFHFCLSLQEYLNISKKTWKDLSEDMEDGDDKEILENIRKEMDNVRTSSIYTYLKVSEAKINLVSMNIFLQGMLYTDSSSRSDVLDYNVYENTTFRKMSVDLMMEFYSAGCKVKREQYLAIIGDVTCADALNASEQEYSNMIGVHTHGHSKEKFWALLRATRGNPKKRDIFVSKSNHVVQKCFGRI